MNVKRVLQSKDLATLRILSEERGGFQDLRKECWSLLLHSCPALELQPLDRGTAQQLDLDVHRSFHHYGLEPDEMVQYQKALKRTLVHVLESLPWLSYYQGFHDIASLFVFVCGESLAKRLLPTVAGIWLRDYMEPTMEASIQYMTLVLDLLRVADPSLYAFFKSVKDFYPYFGISWVLTCFTHQLEHTKAARLMDVLLSRNPVYVCYLSTQVLMMVREELLCCEPDMSELLLVLCNLNFNDMDLEEWIQSSIQLQDSVAFEMDLGKHSMVHTYQDHVLQSWNEPIDFVVLHHHAMENRKRKTRLDPRLWVVLGAVGLTLYCLLYYQQLNAILYSMNRLFSLHVG
jgi:hypothetical protein